MLLEEEEEEAARAAAAAEVEQQKAEQAYSATAAPPVLDDFDDVAGELSELERELAALPSAPRGAAKEESEKVLAEAV